MCGRFVQRYTWDDIQDLYELPDGPARNLQAHYNVAPTDPVNVVRTTGEAARELVSMRWGLIPWWWKKPLKEVPACFNARAESVADKPMFRDAFRRNRCVIPASGYYEWLKRPDGRQPDYISAADGGVLSFAGLWDRWKNPETGEPVISCTIIVTDGRLAVTLSDLTIVLFSLFNFLRLISYLPQIVRIARDKMGPPTISYATWAMWIGANGSTAAYAGVNVHDWMLCLISSVNSFCCIIVVFLMVYKRNEDRQGATMGGEDALAQRAMTPLCSANAGCSHSLALSYWRSGPARL